MASGSPCRTVGVDERGGDPRAMPMVRLRASRTASSRAMCRLMYDRDGGDDGEGDEGEDGEAGDRDLDDGPVHALASAA